MARGEHQLLGVRGDEKGGAMFLFEPVVWRKAKTASPDCRIFPSGKIPEGESPPRNAFDPAYGRIFCYKTSALVARLSMARGEDQLLGVRGDEKGGAMFLFEPVVWRKAKTASPDCRIFPSRKIPEGESPPAQ